MQVVHEEKVPIIKTLSEYDEICKFLQIEQATHLDWSKCKDKLQIHLVNKKKCENVEATTRTIVKTLEINSYKVFKNLGILDYPQLYLPHENNPYHGKLAVVGDVLEERHINLKIRYFMAVLLHFYSMDKRVMPNIVIYIFTDPNRKPMQKYFLTKRADRVIVPREVLDRWAILALFDPDWKQIRQREYQRIARVKDRHRFWAKQTISHHKNRGIICNFTIEALVCKAQATPLCAICGRLLLWDLPANPKPRNERAADTSPSMDRIDNLKCLEIMDVQIICLRCNQMKSTMTMTDFVNHCKRIASRY